MRCPKDFLRLLEDHHHRPVDDSCTAGDHEICRRMDEAAVVEVCKAPWQQSDSLTQLDQAIDHRAHEHPVHASDLEAGVPRVGVGRLAQVDLLLQDQAGLLRGLAMGFCRPERRHAGGDGDLVDVVLLLLVVGVVLVGDEDLVGGQFAALLQAPRELAVGGVEVGGVLQRVDAEDLVEGIALKRHLVVVALHHLALSGQPRFRDALGATLDLLVGHGEACDVGSRDLRNLAPNLSEAAAELENLLPLLGVQGLGHDVVELVVALLSGQAMGHGDEVPEWSTGHGDDVGHDLVVVADTRNEVPSLLPLLQCEPVALHEVSEVEGPILPHDLDEGHDVLVFRVREDGHQLSQKRAEDGDGGHDIPGLHSHHFQAGADCVHGCDARRVEREPEDEERKRHSMD
mmetsp:Transcript_1182/g.2645  ORF Transcript_1182/g.2645 Transcript_1182/m.2645 type:complete len:400 (-) Transcript_1182:18-1217(-)